MEAPARDTLAYSSDNRGVDRPTARLVGSVLAASSCFSDPPTSNGNGGSTGETATTAADTDTTMESASSSPSTTGMTSGVDGSSSAESSSSTGADTTSTGSTGGQLGCADPGAPRGCNDGLVAEGDVCFAAVPDELVEDGGPNELAVGDVDGDGDLDFVVVNIATNQVELLRGNGDGTFASLSAQAANNGRGVALGRLNGDDNLDLAVQTGGGTSVRAFAGDGTGGFTLLDNVALGMTGYDLEIADLDNDGDGDLAVPVYDGILVVFGTGAGFNSPTMIPLGAATEGADHIVLAPMTGTSVDLVSSFYDTNNVGVFLNPGNGGLAFDSATSTGSGNDGPADLEAGDFNGDGLTDIVASVTANEEVYILLNDGAGGLLPDLAPLSANAVALATGDFDGDCVDDLAMIRTSGGAYETAFYASRGDGEFDAPVTVALPAVARDLQLGDFNNDGLADALMSIGGSMTDGIVLIQSQP